MAFNFQQLTAGITDEEALQELKNFLEDQGINVTNWKPGSPSQTNLQLDAYVYRNLVNRIAQQSFNQLNQYASASALTELARSRFQNERVLAVNTSGYMYVSSSSVARPITFLATELKVSDPDNGLTYWNTDQIVLNDSNPAGSFRFLAEEPGVEYNIDTNITMSLVQTQIGLEVTTPPYAIGATTWYDIPGKDEESDNSLRQRNETKFATLQRGESIYRGVEAMVRNATSIEYTKVDDSNPKGPGTVDVYLAGFLDTATPAQVIESQAVLDLNFFGNVGFNPADTDDRRVSAIAAPKTNWNVSNNIVVWIDPSFLKHDIEVAVDKAMNDLLSVIPIGGYNLSTSDFGSISKPHHVPWSLITQTLMDITGVKRVFAASCEDIDVGEFGKLVPPFNNSWTTAITVQLLDKTVII